MGSQRQRAGDGSAPPLASAKEEVPARRARKEEERRRGSRLRKLAHVTNSIEWNVPEGEGEQPLFIATLSDMMGAADLTISNYKKISRLGEGAFSVVDLYQNVNDKKSCYAVKEMKEKKMIVQTHPFSEIKMIDATEKERFRFVCEGLLHALLKHDNVVSCHGCIVDLSPNNGKREAPRMVLEMCANGTLLDRLKKPKYSTLQALRWARQTAAGMAYLHSLGVFHRDLKPENVLLDEHDVAKVADLSLFRINLQSAHEGSLIESDIEEKEDSFTIPNTLTCKPSPSMKLNDQMSFMTGTPRYMAPEAHALNSHRGTYTNKVDVFSFAILTFELLDRRRAYHDKERLTMDQIARVVCEKGLRPKVQERWSPRIKELVSRAWAQEADDRPSFAELVEQLDGIIQDTENTENGETALLGLKKYTSSLSGLVRIPSFNKRSSRGSSARSSSITS